MSSEILDETMDVVENTLDIIENSAPIQVVRNNPITLTVVGIAAFAVGAGAGYLVAKKVLSADYDKRLDEELERTRDYYAVMRKEGKDATPEEAAQNRLPEDVVEALQNYNGTAMVEETEVEVIEERNIFVDGEAIDSSEWDYEAEAATRTPDRPYVICHEEYLEAEPEFDQVAMTYYDGDDVLCDEADKPVDDPDSIVGEDNLLRFGHGSNQSNMVYIRNERIQLDMEISRSTGKYAEEVLGFIEHSDRPRSRRFRWDENE